jgi:hypothetical protein
LRPIGGIKTTEVGEREMAEAGLQFFTKLKIRFINYPGNAERQMIQ